MDHQTGEGMGGWRLPFCVCARLWSRDSMSLEAWMLSCGMRQFRVALGTPPARPLCPPPAEHPCAQGSEQTTWVARVSVPQLCRLELDARPEDPFAVCQLQACAGARGRVEEGAPPRPPRSARRLAGSAPQYGDAPAASERGLGWRRAGVAEGWGGGGLRWRRAGVAEGWDDERMEFRVPLEESLVLELGGAIPPIPGRRSAERRLLTARIRQSRLRRRRRRRGLPGAGRHAARRRRRGAAHLRRHLAAETPRCGDTSLRRPITEETHH
eukprot:gene1086-biopygen11181